MGGEWAKVKDAPWWYNERALVSVFAGAVRRCGGDAFEEFASDKRRVKETGSGRIDLWFALGKREFMAEAKQCWVYSDDPSKSVRLAGEEMDRARKDANCCIPDGRPRLAMVFGVALVPVKLKNDLPAQLQSLASIATATSTKSDAVAWVFPNLKRPLQSSDGFVLPGIILGIRKIR